MRRLASMLGLACLLPIASIGCQTTKWSDARKAAHAKPPTPDQAPVHVGGGTPKTDFQNKVGREQQFNVHMELARLFESQGQFESATGEYQKAIEAAQKHGRGTGTKVSAEQQALAERRMGNALGMIGRFAQADVHYREALKLNPKDAKIWNDQGYSYYMQSRYADAERTLKIGEKMAPTDARVLTNLGLTLAATGRYDAALSALTRAAGPAAGHANLGYLLAAQGQNDLARQHYAKALGIQPDLVVVKQALAKLDHQATQAPPIAIAGVKPPAGVADAGVRRTSTEITPIIPLPKPRPQPRTLPKPSAPALPALPSPPPIP